MDKLISVEEAKKLVDKFIMEYVADHDSSYRELAQDMGYDHSTFLRKLKNPDLDFLKNAFKRFNVFAEVLFNISLESYSMLPSVEKVFDVDVKAKRVPKFTSLLKHPNALEYYERAISEFKHKRRFHEYIKSELTVFTGNARVAAKDIVDRMEKFRCNVIGMQFNKFYRILAEFIVVPSGRKYYPLRAIFVKEQNITSTEFLDRIDVVMRWIADVVHKDFNTQEITKFIEELGKRKIDVKDVEFKSKDWYCVMAIKEFGIRRKWSAQEFLERIGYFYKRRQKKITVEMVLTDLAEEQFEKFDFSLMNKGKKRLAHEGIKRQDWYEKWRQNIPTEKY